MQTTNLPIQVTGAGAASAPQRSGGNGGGEAAQFSAALNREMDQRRQPAAPVAQQQPARPAQQAAKAQQADKPAAQQATPDQAGEPDATQAADGASAAATADDEQAGAAVPAPPAEPSSPVADMLALVASFNQSLRAAAPVAQAEAAAGATLPAALPSAALESLTHGLVADAASGAPAAAGDLLPEALAGKPLKAAMFEGAAAQQFAPALEAASRRAGAAEAALQLPAQAEAPAPAPLAAPVAPQAQLQAAAATPAANALPARVGTPAWDNQVSQKIVWMVAGGDQSAELTLNPPDLGPMQVVLSVTGDQASVTFTASQLEVRQALENALPRLREMMSESGIALGNASVNAGDQRQAQDGQSGGGARLAGNGGETGADEAAARPAGRTTLIGERGMVDTFA